MVQNGLFSVKSMSDHKKTLAAIPPESAARGAILLVLLQSVQPDWPTKLRRGVLLGNILAWISTDLPICAVSAQIERGRNFTLYFYGLITFAANSMVCNHVPP
jgi:hypothetical protein